MTMIDCEHIVWDWNGTLLNDSWVCVEILNTILHKYGKTLTTLQQYRQTFGFPVADFYRSLGFDFSSDPFDGVANDYISQYRIRQFECHLHDGVMEGLNVFRQRNMPQSILSAYHQDLLTEAVTQFDIASYFAHIVGRNDHYAISKVDAGQALIDRLALEPEQLLLIGDTLHDVDVAQTLGMQCILIGNGHQHPDRLRPTGVPVLNAASDVIENVRHTQRHT